MSVYVPHYQHDIFVSYAHVDNEPLAGANKGWVTTLITALKQLLGQKLGREDAYSLWMDYELSGYQPVTPDIDAQLKSVATFLLILSPGYFASPWCLREFNTFLQQVGPGSGRIFMVEKDFIERGNKLPELQELRGYPFWVRSEDTGKVCTSGVPHPNPNLEPKYYQQLKELAEDLAKRLEQLKTLAKKETEKERPVCPRQSKTIQTPGPNPSPENTNEPLKFRNRVNELNLIFGSENFLSENTLVVIDAPAGYGKTALLKEAKKKYEGIGWKCVFVDLAEGFSTEAEIRNEIVHHIGGNRIPLTNSDPDGELVLRIAKFGKIVLLFDSVEKAEKKLVKWLSQFVRNCKDGAEYAFKFRAIFAGRYITTGEQLFKWTQAKMQICPLGPFERDVVHEVIEDMAEQATVKPIKPDYKGWAREITLLSGGHPKIIHNLVIKLRDAHWTTLFKSNKREKLFKECAESEIEEMIIVLKEEDKIALKILSIFRRFDLGTVQKLLERKEVPVTDPIKFIGRLCQLGLVSKNDELGWYSDAIVRKLILIQMKLSDESGYHHLNKVAQEIYDGRIGEIRSKGRVDIGDVHSFIKFFVQEGIYHASQLSSRVDLKELAQYLKKSSGILTDYLGEDENDPNYREFLENRVLAVEDISTTLEKECISSDTFIQSCL